MKNLNLDSKFDLNKLTIIDKLIQKNLKGGGGLGCPPPIGRGLGCPPPIGI